MVVAFTVRAITVFDDFFYPHYTVYRIIYVYLFEKIIEPIPLDSR